MTVTERGHCRESLSGCRDLLSDYCRAVGLCRALSEVTVGLSDRGSGVCIGTHSEACFRGRVHTLAWTLRRTSLQLIVRVLAERPQMIRS